MKPLMRERMVGRTRHLFWFERPLSEALRAVVPGGFDEIGPDSSDDPFDGIEDADAVIASSLYYDRDVIARAASAIVMCRTGIGYDRVDVAAATDHGIAFTNAPDAPTVSTAEHAVALMLAAAKRIPETSSWLRDGQTDFYARSRAVELEGRTLGLVGFGRIARRVAVTGAALGMDVVAFDPYLDDAEFTVSRASSLTELLAESDVVSVHVPLTEESEGMFDASAFAAMKQGSVFVNAARGAIVDQDALVAALDSGRVLSAGLDVTVPEPLPSDHPLLHRSDVVVTPHVASATAAARAKIFSTAIEQALQVLEGQRHAGEREN